MSPLLDRLGQILRELGARVVLASQIWLFWNAGLWRRGSRGRQAQRVWVARQPDARAAALAASRRASRMSCSAPYWLAGW